MKNFALFISFFALNTFGQTYVQIPDSSGVWANKYTSYHVDQNMQIVIDYDTYTYFCTNGQDTIINSTEYTRIDSCLTGTYQGAFRNEIGKVYFVPKGEISEYLLYDFTAQDGDSLFNVYTQYAYDDGWQLISGKVTIPDPDTVLVDNEYRKVLNFEGSEWIEGIGSTSGLFKGSGQNVSNYFINLVCHSFLDTTRFPNDISGEPSCYLHNSVDEATFLKLNLYPNPVNEVLTIEFPQYIETGTLTVLNLLGQPVMKSKIQNASKIQLDLSELSSGNYILRAEIEGTFSVSSLIIKQK